MVAVAAGVLSLWLAATDVYSGIDGWDDGTRPFCGSAYDVALIKHNGDMGGELPPNQDAIDRDCIRRSNLIMLGAAVPGIVAAGSGIIALCRFSRRRKYPRATFLAVATSLLTVAVVFAGTVVAGWAPLGGTVADPVPASTDGPQRANASIHQQWAKRPTLPSCGEVDLRMIESYEARRPTVGERAKRCLRAALSSGRGAELVVRYATVEGDPITEYRRISPHGGSEVYTDSTQDTFGSQAWVYGSCPKPTTALKFDC